MAAREQEGKELSLVVLLAGAMGLAVCIGGVLASSVVWLIGPMLGIAAIVLFLRMVSLRMRPQRRLAAGIGLALAVLSIGFPGYLLYVFNFAGD